MSDLDGGTVTPDENEAAQQADSAADKAAARAATGAPCPKCGFLMELAAVIPHATDQRMAKHTYLCTPCNQTRNYMLPVGAR